MRGRFDSCLVQSGKQTLKIDAANGGVRKEMAVMTAGRLTQWLSKHNPDSEVKFYLDAEFEAEAEDKATDEDTIEVRFTGEVELGSVSRPESGEAAVVLKYRD